MKPLLRIIVIFSVVINLLWLFPALYSLQVFDRVLTSHSTDTLMVLLLGVCIVLVVLGVMDFFRSRLQGVIGNLINDALSPQIARLTLAVGARRQGGFSNEALQDVSRLRAMFSSQGLLAILDAPWAVIYIAVIAMANVWLGLLALGSALLLLAVAYINDRSTRDTIEKLQSHSRHSQRFLDHSMANAEVAQAMGMAPALVGRWADLSSRAADTQEPLARRSVAISSLTKILRQLTQILMTSLGAYLVLQGQITAGVMIAASILLGRALQPVEMLVGSWKVVAEGRLAWRRLGPLMDELQRRKPQMALPAPKGELVTMGLGFRPEKSDRALLTNVTLRLNPGESMSIIGPSGAGKSTLVRLLIGLWSPSQGQVRLDGVDLSTWEREAVGRYIGYMPQEVQLFSGTVSENIARMGPVESEKVVAAAQLARVHEMILSLPNGYDTHIDPNSALLSPGQRQRVALARALYDEPKLVVLDEPNANLDGAGEGALAQTIRDLRGKATVVVVTHRPSITQHLQKMLVIEGGRQAHFGTTEEVLAALRAATAKPDGQVIPLDRGGPQSPQAFPAPGAA